MLADGEVVGCFENGRATFPRAVIKIGICSEEDATRSEAAMSIWEPQGEGSRGWSLISGSLLSGYSQRHKHQQLRNTATSYPQSPMLLISPNSPSSGSQLALVLSLP